MLFFTRLSRLTGLFVLIVLLLPAINTFAAENTIYQLKVYHYKTASQKQTIEEYLEDILVPHLHKIGVAKVGIFKTLETDTVDRRIYVLAPFKSLKGMEQANQSVLTEISSVKNSAYVNAPFDKPAYTRLETVVMTAFYKMPSPAVPALTAPKDERIYELRSYESATESLFINKVKMFNAGDEVGLFNRLGFNAVFYASVTSGERMPNLMYMTTFNSKADRDKHWEAFGADAYWKELSAKPEYQQNVSKADIIFLQPADYSDFSAN